MNRTDLQALTLLGPTNTSSVIDPLAVLCLDNHGCFVESVNQYKISLATQLLGLNWLEIQVSLLSMVYRTAYSQLNIYK